MEFIVQRDSSVLSRGLVERIDSTIYNGSVEVSARPSYPLTAPLDDLGG